MRRYITDRVILAVGWAWFLIYAYPGYMAFDSASQLAQARGLEPLNDWQPPLMAVIWRGLDAIIAGPFLMLVVQSVLFLGGSYALLARALRPRTAAIVAVILLVAPQNITVLAVVWKDGQMVGFLIAGTAALFSLRRGWRIFGYACLFLATGVRYNAAAATFPIFLFQVGYAGVWPQAWKRLALASGAWLAITGGAFATNALLTETHMHPWAVGAAPLDIAGTINYAPDLDNDQLLRDTAGVPWYRTDDLQHRIRALYRPQSHIHVVTLEPDKIIEMPATEAERTAIAAAWKKLVFAHPGAYVHHRWSVFVAQLADKSPYPAIYSQFTDDNYIELLGHHAVHSKLQRAWVAAMQWFNWTPLFHIGFYFVLSILLVPLCRHDRASLLVLLSGIANELGLFVAAPAVGYRYSQWLVACALLGLVLGFRSRR